MALRIRRGTSTQRTSITPVSGELIYDTTQNKLYVGNGLTAGGIEIVAGQIGGNLGSNINLNNFDITGAGNINITGTITASGTITGNGDLVLGNADTDNVQFGADINSNIVPNTSTLTVGTSAKPWQTVFAGALENNAGITSNSNLTLNGLVTVGNNLIPNTTRTKDLGTTSLRWRSVNAETLALENIQITQNNIRSLDSNSDINIEPSGTGSVSLSSAKVRTKILFGTNSGQFVTAADAAGIYYGFNSASENYFTTTTHFSILYTQLASTTQETFTLAPFDTSQFNGFKFFIHATNSQGSETFELTGNSFGGALSISAKQNNLTNSGGVGIISAVSTTAGAGNNVNIRLTTTNQINSGVVTTFKVYSISYKI